MRDRGRLGRRDGRNHSLEALEKRSLLSAVFEAEPNNSYLTYQALIGDTGYRVSGTISTENDQDWYGIEVEQGQRIGVNVRALNPTAPVDSQLDPIAWLMSPSGISAVSDDNGGIGSALAAGFGYTATE